GHLLEPYNSNCLLNPNRRRTSVQNCFTSLRSADAPSTVAGPAPRRIGGSIDCRSIFSSHPVKPALCTPCSFCHPCPWSRPLLSQIYVLTNRCLWVRP